MSGGGQYSAFRDVAIVEAVRTPQVDLGGALAPVSPIDLGIKVGREVLARAAIEPDQVDSVLAGSMAQASFDAYLLPRHIGLYSGVAQSVPALGVQRICATGFELLRRAALHVGEGGQMALCVAAESMSRNPIAAYTHRNGFSLGAAVQFKDFLWEALYDPAPAMDMIATADNLAGRHGLSREAVDSYALLSHERALQSQISGKWTEEIVPVGSERFELDGYQQRGIELPRGLKRSRRTAIRVRPIWQRYRVCAPFTLMGCRPQATAVRSSMVPLQPWWAALRNRRDRCWRICWPAR